MFNVFHYLKPIPATIIVLSMVIVGCTPTATPSFDLPTTTPSPTEEITVTKSTITITITVTQTTIPPSKTPTSTPTPTATTTADGCKKPSDNYDRVNINGHFLNQRTYEMLKYAQTLYDGQIDIIGDAITQGSYTTAVEASFGTHAGGGAVDLSVIAREAFIILYDEIEPLIHALRLAGFAAWYRDLGDLYPGSPVHIHAIAIGDQELSLAAREQLTGPHGYFWGYNGLPIYDDAPNPDPHGGPILCDWMIEMNYPHRTETPSPEE
jgi:hypothetical protein